MNMHSSFKLLVSGLLLTGFTSLLCIDIKAQSTSKYGKSKPVSTYSTDVLDQWMAMQIRLMSSTIANFNGPFIRVYAYSSIAAYLSVCHGLPSHSPYRLLTDRFNHAPEFPLPEKGKSYYWPASLNAAMGNINRVMFRTTNYLNKAAIDSLENLLFKKFSNESDAATLERSAAFGQNVANKVFDWAEIDGYRLANDPFAVPSGPGKWEPTPPSFARPVTPHWGKLRTMVRNSIENTAPPPPPPYSEDTASDFYKMIRPVYDASQNLTDEQRAIALFWRDINPGLTAPGHWLNVLRQLFRDEKSGTRLDKAVFAWALSGISLNDTWITCWKTRYEHNLMRPVTYIQKVMGYKEWQPFIVTPPHPEYTAGFAAMAGAITQSLTEVYGEHYSMTDHTYDYLGMNPRTFTSFTAMAEEAGMSKFLGGIHYKISIDMGLWQGREVARNIARQLTGLQKQARR
ncbi:MAG TPA: vanadium-dependent haloperoxidase [Chitinophagaceae bacterium]|nr:vanadium-dependent haloperoxidase [Chitinophagaceae bacterium]